MNRFVYLIGIVFIAIGLVVLLDQYLDTGWLPLAVAPVAGILLLQESRRKNQFGYWIAGSLTLAAGIALLVGLGSWVEMDLQHRIGWGTVVFAPGWWLIFIRSAAQNQKTWWAFLVGGVIAAIGLCLVYTPARPVDLGLYILTSLGVIFLIWGMQERVFGLLIPGSLLVTIGPGIFIAWKDTQDINSLAQTGVMLVIFAIGWGLIVLFARMLTEKFIWWPLIPGGVLAVVGWGLYIGGNPANAANFVANTGSIGLIIFGLYLLLMRRGIQH